MSDAVAALRAKALSRIHEDHPLEFVLDEDLRKELTDARDSLAVLLEAREKMEAEGNLPPAEPSSLADATADTNRAPQADIDRMITACQEVITSIQDEAIATGNVLVAQFRRLTPQDYEDEVTSQRAAARRQAKAKDEHRSENEILLVNLRAGLLRRCYHRSETPGGEDLGLTLEELRDNVFDHADEERAEQHALSINRTGAAVPFLRASSGRPATS